MCRQLVEVPINSIDALFIRVITTNNIRAISNNSANTKSVWIKAKEGHVMVNVDANSIKEILQVE
jgi:hypothetical protein